MAINMELRKATDGTHFVIVLRGNHEALVIPLSPALSGRIHQMLIENGFKTELPFLPPVRLKPVR